MKKFYKKQKGFTLIETIVYIGIFSIIIISFITFQNEIRLARINNQVILEINNQSQRIMEIITFKIRSANNVNTPIIGNNSSNLTLNMTDNNTDPTSFFIEENILYMKEGINNQIPLTNDKIVITDLNFSNLSLEGTNDIIKIDFYLSPVSSLSNSYNYSIFFTNSAQLRK